MARGWTMAIINRPRLRGVLVEQQISEEPAAVEFVDALAEEVEASQNDFVTEEDQEREVGRLEAAVERAAERIEATFQREIARVEAKLDRAVERLEARLESEIGQVRGELEREIGQVRGEMEQQRTQSAADHSETRRYIAESHLRTVGLILGGLAVATAILAIVIAAT